MEADLQGNPVADNNVVRDRTSPPIGHQARTGQRSLATPLFVPYRMPGTRTAEETNGTCRAHALDAASKQRVMQMNDDGIVPPADRRERGTLRAADSDRDQIAELLNVAFSEGRLSKDDYDSRLARALSARTYADLEEIVTGRHARHDALSS